MSHTVFTACDITSLTVHMDATHVSMCASILKVLCNQRKLNYYLLRLFCSACQQLTVEVRAEIFKLHDVGSHKNRFWIEQRIFRCKSWMKYNINVQTEVALKSMYLI